MADLFDLVAKLTLDSSEYSSGLDSALGKAKSIGGTIAKVGTAAVGAAAAGIVAFGKSAVETAANYETSFAQLQTIMDSTAVSTDKMSEGLLEMSSRMGVSASELAETTYNAISATGDTAGALSIVENATKLATAGFTDTASSLSVLTTAMNSYKMSAEETAGISDSLIAVQNLGVTTVAELSSSMGKAIASASAYSVDLYNLESAYVSMTKSGINTAESTTYISSMMKELGSDSTAVAKLLKTKTGKSFAQLMKDGNSLGDVLGVLNEAVDGDANALMNLWGSAEAGKASNAILSQGLEQFNENLIAIQNSAGLTESAYDKMTSTLQHKTNLLKTNFENLKIAVGSGMIPGVGEFIDLITKSVGGITDAVQAGDWDKAFDVVGETVGDGLTLIGEKAPDIVNGAMRIISSLGSALINNADSLIGSAEKVLDTFLGALGNGKDFGDTAGQLIVKIANAIGNNTGKILVAASNIITDLGTGLLSSKNVAGYVTAAGNIVSGIVGALPNVVTTLWSGGETILDGIVQGATKGAATAAGQIVGSLIKAIKDVFANKNMMEVLSDMMLFITNPGAALFTKIQKALSDPSVMGNFMVGLYKGMNPDKTDITNDNSGGRKRVTDATTAGTEATEKNTEAVVKNADAFTKANHALTDADKNFGSYTSSATKSVAANNGLNTSLSSTGAAVSGAGGKFGELSGAVQTTTTQLNAATSSIQQSVENLQTMGDAAGNAVTGFETIAQGLINLQTAINNVPQSFGAMWSFVKGIFANAPAFFGNVGSQSAQQFVAPWNDVPGKMQNVWNNIKSVFNKTGEAYVWGYDLSKNFAEGISNGANLAVQAAQALAQRIKDNLGFSEPKEGPLSDFHTYAPDMMELFADGVNENQRVVLDSVRNAFDFRDAITAPETMTYSSTADGNAQQSTVDTKLDAIADKLDALADAILNQAIEMDGDVVAEKVDRRLGMTAAIKARV